MRQSIHRLPKIGLPKGQSARELDYDIHFWRTKSGLEVDFIPGPGEVAIEVRGTSRIDNADLRPL